MSFNSSKSRGFADKLVTQLRFAAWQILPEGLVPWLLEDRLTSFRFLLLIWVKSSKEGSRARDETNLTSEDGVDTLDEFVGGLGAGFFLLGPRSTL
mgnify:CR=1 FL=1